MTDLANRLWQWFGQYGRDLPTKATIDFINAMQVPREPQIFETPRPLVTAAKIVIPSIREPNTCRRGQNQLDGSGLPFDHQRGPESNICIWCGDGAPLPPPEAFEKQISEIRFETVACAEHGSHKLAIRQDGTYDKPDCEMFS